MQFFDERLSHGFWSRVIPEPTSGCWLWIGATSDGGYGRIKRRENGVVVYDAPHRAVMTVEHGAIPPRLVIDHKCETPSCCNPDHLQIVTYGINRSLAFTRAKTCARGHDLKVPGSVVMVNARGRQERRCATCMDRGADRSAGLGLVRRATKRAFTAVRIAIGRSALSPSHVAELIAMLANTPCILDTAPPTGERGKAG